MLSGCQSIQKKLKKLGYSEEEIAIIETFAEETQEVFLNEYKQHYVEFIKIDGCIETKLDKYDRYYGLFDNEQLIDLVNRNIINDKNKDKLNDLYNSEFYIDRLEDIYLEYIDDYDNVRDLLEVVNTNRYKNLYTDIQTTDLSKDYLILVNKYYQLPSDYEPDDLVDIDYQYGSGQTRKEVYEQYKKLQDEANALGYDFSICSGYRSYSYQESLYNKYLAIDGSRDIVDTYSARPGHSEHQSALCLDLSTPGYGMDNFGLSEAGKWVYENCYKYGFIIRYTDEKQDITGYEGEAWQIRYVGSSEIAKYIMDTGITFDEYYACFVE